jgi:hypothetical protein
MKLGQPKDIGKMRLERSSLNFSLWQNQKILMSEGKLCTYLKVKHNFGFENYLTIIKKFEQRKIFTRFRISANRLRIELGRCQGTPRQDIICLHCSSGEVEDEIHPKIDIMIFC